MKLLSVFVFIVLFISCKQEGRNDAFSLKISDTVLSFSMDEHTKIPQISVFPFTDTQGHSYLSFQNDRQPEILVYDIKSGELLKKMRFAVEGDQAIPGGFFGYYIQDFDHIYMNSMYEGTLFVTDSTKTVRQRIDYQVTTDTRQRLIPVQLASGSQLQFVGNKLYLPQAINPMLGDAMNEKSPVCVVIDSLKHIVKGLPMRFPPLITRQDIGTTAGFGAEYSRCFNGSDFVYAFKYQDQIYRTSPEHVNVEEFPAKSRYIDRVQLLRMKSDDMKAVFKATCEHPTYGSILYDKYRKVYYRFAYPKTEIEPGEDYLEIIRSGKKVFSVMILDENLKIVGETLFPEYTYNPNLSFVLEGGLYISTNHSKNPAFTDDELSFQRMDLIHTE